MKCHLEALLSNSLNSVQTKTSDALSPYISVLRRGAPAPFVRRAAPFGKVSKENLLSVTVNVAMATVYRIQGAHGIVCAALRWRVFRCIYI